MKILPLVLLFVPALFAQRVPASPKSPALCLYDPTRLDPSKISTFLARKDALTIQTHYPVANFETGDSHHLRIEALLAMNAIGDRTTLKAVRLFTPGTPQAAAQIDLDEVQLLSRTLEAFSTTAGQWQSASPGNRTQLTLNAREGFQIAMTWTQNATTISLRFSDRSEARFNMQLSDLPRFKQAIDAAISLLQSK